MKPKKYSFSSRADSQKERIGMTFAFTRMQAATIFAEIKKLELKAFLRLYEVSR
jgi:hypothetical protein